MASWSVAPVAVAGRRASRGSGCDRPGVTRQGGSRAVVALPLHERSVAVAGRQLAFLITGDGGYAAGDRGIADALVARGIPVIALDARDYLKKKRTPDEAASDAALIMRHY